MQKQKANITSQMI